MKIVVYAIAKNEEKHVNRFMDSVAPEADAVYVLDTGSADKTVDLLKERGAIVKQQEIKPWRFDVARNESLAMVPEDVDVCVCIDLDEVLTPGWRKEIEKVWTPDTNQLQYNYIWRHAADGSAAVNFLISKIHQRHGFTWKHPVHEIIKFENDSPVVRRAMGFEVKHYPDDTKSRSMYMPLLEMSVKEDPSSDRNSHYLGREYMLAGKYEEAIKELTRHLSLPTAIWDVERAASMRFISRSHLRLKRAHEARVWALRACAETPFEREPWWELANVAHATRDWRLLYFASTTALSNGKQGEKYIADPTAWDFGPYDYAAVGAYYIGFKADAAKYGALALEVAKKNNHAAEVIERLKKNLTEYTKK